MDRASPSSLLLQWILGNEQRDLFTAVDVRYALALVFESMWEIELLPAIALAFSLGSNWAAAAFVVRDETCQRLAFVSDEDIVFDRVDRSFIDRPVNAAFGRFERLPRAVRLFFAAAVLDLYCSRDNDVMHKTGMVVPCTDIAGCRRKVSESNGGGPVNDRGV